MFRRAPRQRETTTIGKSGKRDADQFDTVEPIANGLDVCNRCEIKMLAVRHISGDRGDRRLFKRHVPEPLRCYEWHVFVLCS